MWLSLRVIQVFEENDVVLKKLWVLGCLGAALAASPALANETGSPGKDGGAHANEKIFTGKFTAVDAAGGSVTLENKTGERHTVAVPADAKIEVNGKQGTLADVQVGMYGGVKLINDSVAMLRAQSAGEGDKHRFFTGKVTAVDGASLTLTNRAGESNTFAVPADAKVQINGQPGSLANAKVDMYGGVKLGEDGKTVLEVRLYEPKGDGHK
jgi:hypothetical protein